MAGSALAATNDMRVNIIVATHQSCPCCDLSASFLSNDLT